jgi:hypothetical protein
MTTTSRLIALLFISFTLASKEQNPEIKKETNTKTEWLLANLLPKSLTTYVNGKQELHEETSFLPIETGQTSIGVRLNKVSWFKGAIYKIRITPKQINPNRFMSF